MKEFYGSVTYYGIGTILRNYARFPSFLPLPVSVQHGWEITPYAHDARKDAPENWYWSVELEKKYRQAFPEIKTRAVGAPFLYLLRNEHYTELPLSERKGTIVFPSHSSDLVQMRCDFDAYADMLCELPDEYKPITVCMYYLDLNRGLEKPFARKGFEIVSNGSSLYDVDFLKNFIRHTKDKRYAMSNQMTSALLYASAMGLKAFLWGPTFTVLNFDPNLLDTDYNEHHRKWEQQYRHYFAFPDCDLLTQREFVMEALGRGHMLSSRNMRFLLWRLVLSRRYFRSLFDVTLGYLEARLAIFLRAFLPPVIASGIRQVRRRIRYARAQQVTNSQMVEWEYIPEGWVYARTHPEIKGWNVQDVLETYKQKWPRFVTMVQGTGPLGVAHESDLATNADIHSHNTMMAFAYALALAARKKDTLSILDWGGGIGHYYLLAQALLPDVRIEYHCKDVPLLAEYGAQLFPDQHFYADESCLARTYDFVLASASLHYSEDWRRVLAGLAKATSGYLYITRLPTVAQAPSYVFIQRPYAYGYNTEYLGWCLNKAEFLAEASRLGLTLVREFVIGEQPPITNAPGTCQYRGFLFRLREK